MDRRTGAALLGLLVLTAALYGPVVTGAGVLYEDAHWLAGVGTAPVAYPLPGRGLSAWTLHLMGTSAPAQHAGNLALHLLNGGLVAALASSLIGPIAGVVSAGVFLLHPMNSHAVSYVAARPDLLMTTGVLIALVCAVRQPWSWWAVTGTALALVGAATSKEIGVIGMPLVVLTALLYRRRSMAHTALVPLWIGLGALGGYSAHVIARWAMVPAALGGPSTGWLESATLQMTAIWHLLALVPPSALWFTGFSIDHDIVGLSSTWTLVAGLLTIQALTLLVWTWHRAPMVAWALGWLGVSLAPRLVFRTSEFVTEPQMYLPMVGVSLGLGALAVSLWSWRPTAQKAMVYG